MAIPKTVSFVTFDVYGTLIDWDTGAFEAFSKEAVRDGFTVERDTVLPLFHQTAQEIESGSYELYAEVLRRTAVRIAKELGWALEPSRSTSISSSPPSRSAPTSPTRRTSLNASAGSGPRRGGSTSPPAITTTSNRV